MHLGTRARPRFLSALLGTNRVPTVCGGLLRRFTGRLVPSPRKFYYLDRGATESGSLGRKRKRKRKADSISATAVFASTRQSRHSRSYSKYFHLLVHLSGVHHSHSLTRITGWLRSRTRPSKVCLCSLCNFFLSNQLLHDVVCEAVTGWLAAWLEGSKVPRFLAASNLLFMFLSSCN